MPIGVARLVPGEEATEWLERADKALYAAKRAGRVRVMTADGALLASAAPTAG